MAEKVAPRISLQLQNGTELNITEQTFGISVPLHSQVTFVCQAAGCPKPKSTWLKDGLNVSNEQRLVKSSVNVTDRGFYLCTSEGMSSNAVRLTIQG